MIDNIKINATERQITDTIRISISIKSILISVNRTFTKKEPGN